MKTSLVRTSLLVAVATAAAFAQNSTPLRVNVPFNFIVGSRALPSGAYTVNENLTTGVLTISDSEDTATIVTHAAESTAGPGSYSLVFHRYGDTYFLSQVWNGEEYGREISSGPREREMTAKRIESSTVTVAALR
jgi:hypothetical protein